MPWNDGYPGSSNQRFFQKIAPIVYFFRHTVYDLVFLFDRLSYGKERV
jgi:hypothetical protein